MASEDDIGREIAEQVAALGFATHGVCGIAAAAPAGARLRAWIAAGHHGDMGWMAERLAWRADAATLWPEARSVIMLADSYAPETDPLATLAEPERAAVSVYAAGKDYHDTVKKRLKRLGRWLIDRAGGEIKVFVDTAPVMEKPLAEAAGLGWQGKHSNLVSRSLGSWFFLGAVFTTLELAPRAAHRNHCGGCRRCLDICPTAAFPTPYVLDARRCISYLTIELKGAIPRAMRPLIGNRIYGCDDCLAVCPWNKFARSAHPAYAPRLSEAPLLADLALLDDAAFRALFSGSPIKRIGRARFLRNVAVAIGNSRRADLLPAAQRLARDDAPLVRAHGVWALGRLGGHTALRAAWRDDPDPEVAAEWAAALADAELACGSASSTTSPHG
ncbi:MAG: tRNA epoxyqueuosine(34) reductase QueG [Pseudomonadota bacterium]